MRKQRVAFFSEVLVPDYDGATRTMFQFLDRMDTTAFDYHFFSGIPPEHSIGHPVTTLPAITLPFNRTYKMSAPWRNRKSIIHTLDTFKPDVIHIATPSPLGSFALGYAKRSGLPVITIYHTHFVSYMKYYGKGIPVIPTIAENICIRHTRKFYNRCDQVLVPTEAMIDTLSEIGVERSRMTLWQRGLDNKLFSPQRKDIATIRSITKNSKKNILFASRLVWEKNLDVLIQIYQEMNQRKLPYNLIIAGDGVARQDLERRMPGAHFLGHQTHESLAMLYASSDYFVFPSTTETYGNVIIESMASGLPCVIADAGGSGSLVRHGETGMLCDPNDPKDYLNKIQLLEEHPDLRYRMIEAGLVFTQPLHWDRLAEQYYHYVNTMGSQVNSQVARRTTTTSAFSICH